MTHPAWPAIEAAYRDGGCTVVHILSQYGISQSQLYTHARRNGWPPRRKHLPVRGAILRSTAKPEDISVSMLSRLSQSLAVHINELESAVKKEDRSEADREQETKLLTALTQVLDKLSTLAGRLDPPKDEEIASIAEIRANQDRIVAAIADRVTRLGNERAAEALLAGADPQRG